MDIRFSSSMLLAGRQENELTGKLKRPIFTAPFPVLSFDRPCEMGEH